MPTFRIFRVEAGLPSRSCADRKAPKEQRRTGEKGEIEKRAEEEEVPVQIGALGVEQMIESRRDGHPFIKLTPENQDRDEEHQHHRHEQGQIFQLPADDDRPFRIGRRDGR